MTVMMALDAWGDPLTGEVGHDGLVSVERPDPRAAGWSAGREVLPGQEVWLHRGRKLLALLGLGTHGGRRWLHLSVRHASRIPAWEELVFSKETLLGSYQGLVILPPRERWVNQHPHVLHVWACLDGDGLPQFEAETGTI